MTDTTPTPNETISENHDLLWKLINTFDQHVNELVEKKVIQIFQTRATLALIDAKTEERIRDIAGDLIAEHESDYEHIDRDEISDTVATHIANTDFDRHIKQAVHEMLHDGDYPTEERVQEMLDDVDFEEKVKEVLRNI